MSEPNQVDRAIETLVADWLRQGEQLHLDQVNRVLTRRGVTGEAAERVLEALHEQGVEVAGVDPSSMGFEASHHLKGSKGSPGTSDGLGLFLHDVSKYALLTAADEQRLGRRIALAHEALEELEPSLPADFSSPDDSRPSLAVRLRRFKEYLRSEETSEAIRMRPALVRQIQDGQEAFDHLVAANIRLVVHNGRAYGRLQADLHLVDIIQDGCLGLIRAAEKFNHALGYKFSTYATWWIRQAIERGIANHGKLVRLPVHVHERKLRLDKAKRSLTNELGRNPTARELADQLQWSVADVQGIEDLASFEAVSLDAPATGGDEEGEALGSLVASSFDDPADIALEGFLRAALFDALDRLSERERKIIEMRYGLHDDEKYTLEEVGRHFGLTREAIRQIQNKSIEKLRDPAVSESLTDFV